MFPNVDVVNFNEKEESTCISEAVLLCRSRCKRLFVVPFFSIITLFAFPVYLYWRKTLQRDWLYTKSTSIKGATHLYIAGRDGNKEIVKLIDFTTESEGLTRKSFGTLLESLTIFFTYRFINFEWSPNNERFEPIKFICEGKPFDELRATYTNPERTSNE